MFAFLKPHIVTFVFLLLLAASDMSAQYRFDTWTTDNGLPQNGVRKITQTPDGYLWLTTFDGLVRFDGVKFTTFNKSNTPGIINNRFTNIHVDRGGTLYATTMEDGILTILHDGVFSSFTSDQVPGHYIETMSEDSSGRMRFLIENEDRRSKSWYVFENGKFEPIEPHDPNPQILNLTGQSDSEWLVTRKLVTETRDGVSTTYSVDSSKYPFTPHLFDDGHGNLWIGENQVHKVGSGEQKLYGTADGLSTASVYHSFWREPDGSTWFGSGGSNTTGVGLVQVDQQGSIRLWGYESGLTGLSTISIFHDREGTTWIATDRGLARRRRQAITGIGKAEGLDHSEVYPLLRHSNGEIWVGANRGLSVKRNGTFETPSLRMRPGTKAPERLIWRPGHMSVQSLWEEPGGAIWVGVNGGIFIVQGDVVDLLYDASHVFAIKSDKVGNVWAATSSGLLRFRDRKLESIYQVKDGLPNDFMTTIFQDSADRLWFGGYGGLTLFQNGEFINFTRDDGLAGNYVRSMYEDDHGVMWIGTYDEGMSRYKDGRFFNYNERNGLYNNGVFAIEPDNKGNFWISSNNGIYRVKRDELNELADGKLERINSVGYGREDGMLSAECNGGRQPASFRDDAGRIWFPTQEGIAIVDPEIENVASRPPPVVIESVSVEREPVDFRYGIDIDAGKKNLEIQFTGISFLKSSQIRFKYKLEGHDQDWIDAGTRRAAYYSNLEPGKYSFKVHAVTSDGVWSESPAFVNLEFRPYFYQTRWFFLSALAFAAFLLLIVWKVSVKQLEAREKRLSQLVHERTMELAMVNETLEALANSDGLTKIGNRRRFESFLADEWHRAIRFKTPISLVMIDIDHFKQYNDAYGHQAGDECLQRVADALASSIHRPTDIVARLGGEEFVLVLGGTDAAGAAQIAQTVFQNIRDLRIPHLMSQTSERLTVSIGIATSRPVVGDNDNELLNLADRALYLAKRSGRDRIVHYDPADLNHQSIHVSDSVADQPAPPVVPQQGELPYLS